jgi:hypothetical protein
VPEARAIRARLLLGFGVAHPFCGRLFVRVLFVMPRETGFDLLEARVDRVVASAVSTWRQQHASDDAAVAILFPPDDENGFVVDVGRKVLARAFAVRLAPFRRIDPGEADLVLKMGRVEQRDGIAVGNCDDGSEKVCCARSHRDGEQKQAYARDTRTDSGLLGPRLCGGVQKSTRAHRLRVLRFVGPRPRAVCFPHNYQRGAQQ